MSAKKPKTLLVATTNPGKIREVKALLKGSDFEVVTLDDVGLSGIDVEETGKTFEANAKLKAKFFAKKSGLLTLADDSGLMVIALEGRPGVYSKRYGSSDPERIQKLLAELSRVSDRSARFVSVVALHDPVINRTLITVGEVLGEITQKAEGHNGFGYDPIFYSPDLNKTFGRATGEEKNRVSHRGRALAKMSQILKSI